MSTFSTGLKDAQKTFGGGKGPTGRIPGGGGGGGRGDRVPDFGENLRRYRLGMGIGLAGVMMLFVSFTSAFIVRQGLGSYDQQLQAYVTDWTKVSLPMGLLLINTLILVVSSLTLEMARRRSFQQAAVAGVADIPGVKVYDGKGFPWLGVTLVLGFSFLAGQMLAWRELMAHGYFVSGNPSTSFIYVLTGMHAIHLAGGLLALLYAGTAVWLRSRPLERRRIIIDVTAWYWHFMALLWIYIFVLLRFVG